MNENIRKQILETSWEIHAEVENSYLANKAVKGDAQWQEKQRILLADMAIHLLQTALNSGELQTDKLANNVHAILTISDMFLPDAKLAQATENLYRPSEEQIKNL